MASSKVIITIRTQKADHMDSTVDMLSTIIDKMTPPSMQNKRIIRVFNNAFELIAAINPDGSEYAANFVYIYTGPLTTYNVSSWTGALSVLDSDIKTPAFYFYKTSLPGVGISSGCNQVFSLVDIDVNTRVIQSLKNWSIV